MCGKKSISEEFDISNGVRQGDVLAPVLFNLFFDTITAATLSQHPGSGVRMLFNFGGSCQVKSVNLISPAWETLARGYFVAPIKVKKMCKQNLKINIQNKDQSGTDKYNHAEVSVTVVHSKLKKNNGE